MVCVGRRLPKRVKSFFTDGVSFPVLSASIFDATRAFLKACVTARR